MPRKLLLADDSVTIQKVVAIVFAHEDYQVTAVANGDDAIARARELQPDIVLADVVMPGKDGYQVCEALKADPATRHIPVLLLAGTFEPFDEARATAAGYDGHMPKPFESARLLEKVRQLVEGQRATTAAPAVAPPPRQQPTPLPSASGGPARPIAPMPPPAAPAAPVRPLASRPAVPLQQPPAPRPPASAAPFAPRPAAPPPARPPASVILPPRPAAPGPIGGATLPQPPPPTARPPQPAAPVPPPAPPVRHAPASPGEDDEILLDVDELDFADEAEPVAPAPSNNYATSFGSTGAGRRPYGVAELRGTPVEAPARRELEAEPALLAPGAAGPRVDLSELDALEGRPAAFDELAPPPEPLLGSPVDERLERVEPAAAQEPARAAAEAASFLAAVERTPAMRGGFPAPDPAPVANTAVPAIAATPVRTGDAADGGEAALRAAISAASREVIEKIAWEVVPQLAEVILREHVERLVRAREGRDRP